MSDDTGGQPHDEDTAPAPEDRLDWLDARLPWAVGSLGLDIGLGWVELVTDLHADLAAVAPGYEVVQVKTKFGGLRYYAQHPPDLDESASARFHARIARAEAESQELCEECGSTGWLVSDRGWLRTVCELHGLS